MLNPFRFAYRFLRLAAALCTPLRLFGQTLLGDSPGDHFHSALFAFTLGGQSSSSLLVHWPQKRQVRRLDGHRTEYSVLWTQPETGLELTWQGIEYSDFQAWEWTVYLRNKGTANTPVLEDFEALDATLASAPRHEFVLHGNKGDWCAADSWEPFDFELDPGSSRRFAPYGGRPTNAAFPYYNLQRAGGGLFIAVGWPGQWESSFVRDSGRQLRIRAGQEQVHLYLKPGETVRSPLIALVAWQGTDLDAAQNVWRRWMLAHNLPRSPAGELPAPQIVACSSHQFKEMTEANESNQELFIDRYLAEKMPLDYWWMDAGWYPCAGQWTNTGTWEPDATRFPHGLRPVSDHAHARGVKTILWFEPERVGDPNSWLARQHPEWLLTAQASIPPPPGSVFGSGPGSLLNLGDPRALHWLIDHVDRTLTEQGIDFYRQDFNIEPLPFWRGADSPDRQGATENFYVQGYLAYWDALQQLHPGLRIDTCASGGRRNDLETLRRAVPLLRSDYLFEPTSQQCHHFSYASWIPYEGCGYAVGHSALAFQLQAGIDAYEYRSNMCASLNLCYDVRKPDLDYALAARLFAQLKQIGPYYLGDFYPLTPYSRDNAAWMAWQCSALDGQSGIVQAFRRPASPTAQRLFVLKGLDPSGQYLVTDLDHPADARRMTGAALMARGLAVNLSVRPGAAVIAYRAVR